MAKITLCGSTKFMPQFMFMNSYQTLLGNVVYSVGVSTKNAKISPHQKELLDLVHLIKIQESDSIVVVTDENLYVGESTRREMQWAKLLNKPIKMYSFDTDENTFESWTEVPEAQLNAIMENHNII